MAILRTLEVMTPLDYGEVVVWGTWEIHKSAFCVPDPSPWKDT